MRAAPASATEPVGGPPCPESAPGGKPLLWVADDHPHVLSAHFRLHEQTTRRGDDQTRVVSDEQTKN